MNDIAAVNNLEGDNMLVQVNFVDYSDDIAASTSLKQGLQVQVTLVGQLYKKRHD